MEFDLTTPALLFSTISLLLLAFTNRFLALASVIRKLHSEHKAAPDPVYVGQIQNLQRRVHLIRDMQSLGVCSLLSCTICMTSLFFGWVLIGKIVFGVSLVLMCSSLALSLVEIRISVDALHLHLKDMET